MSNMIDPYTIRTYGGSYLSFADPKVEDIEIEDIARALSRAPRFGGHTRPFYSVAQHVVTGSWWVRNVRKGSLLESLQMLHHDDSEAYISDMPTPAKALMPDYYAVEKRLQDKINEKFGLPQGSQSVSAVKDADVAMLFLERDEMIDDSVRWSNEDQHPGGTMRGYFPGWQPWGSDEAMDHYLHQHQFLTEQMNLTLARAA